MNFSFNDLKFLRPDVYQFQANKLTSRKRFSKTKKYKKNFQEIQWALRPYAENDRPAILALYRKCFAKEFTPAEWQWKYFHNPHGRPIMVVADDLSSGQILSYVAAIPCPIRIGSCEETAYLIVDSMADRLALGQGVYGHLASHLCELILKNKGLPLTMPNKKSMKNALLVMSNKGILKLDLYFRVLEWSAEIKKHAGALAPLLISAGKCSDFFLRLNKSTFCVEPIERFGSEADDLWLRIRDKFKIVTVRTAERLNWRYFQNPSADYHIYAVSSDRQWLGYAVTRVTTRENTRLGLLVDFFFDPDCPQAGKALMVQCITDWKKNAVEVAAIVFAGPASYKRLFWASGFCPNQQKWPRQFFLVTDFMGVKNFGDIRIQRHEETLFSKKNWFWNLGDSDII